MAEQVVVQQSSVARAWRQMGGDDTWVQLRTKVGSLADFGVAVERANEAAATRGDGDGAFAAFPASTPRGFAVQLIRATTMPAVKRWLADFATDLAAVGFTGTIGGAPDASGSPCLFPTLPPVSTGYVVWGLDPTAMRDERRKAAGWLVGPAATTRITELADRWARRPGAQIVLRQNIYSMAIDLSDAAPQLAQSVTETGMAGLDFIIDKNTHATHTALAFGGEGVFQIAGGPDTWQQRIATLTQALTALPADTNQAYIRISLRNQINHDQLHTVLPLPGIGEADIRYNKHLLDRYLPDAHGIQVVRTAHLDNANNLSNWHITDLGHGRHLVQAPDLTPWYADTLPNPETLNKARADFAGALLTKQIITDNPPPR